MLLFNPTDLFITITSPAGVPSTLVQTVDYTVNGLITGGGMSSVGSITLVNASQAWLTAGNLSTGWGLSISRLVPIVQNTSLRNQGDFFPEVVENQLDYLTMLIQQMQQQINNAGTSLILTDIITGSTYRLIMVNGVLNTLQLS